MCGGQGGAKSYFTHALDSNDRILSQMLLDSVTDVVGEDGGKKTPVMQMTQVWTEHERLVGGGKGVCVQGEDQRAAGAERRSVRGERRVCDTDEGERGVCGGGRGEQQTEAWEGERERGAVEGQKARKGGWR